ncbi:12325_t:CDS:2 [Entrophospora sp. SA101]|nr:12325_t:CDS:2 [Entrophospora sp. SA101]
MKAELDLLRQENARLMARITELEQSQMREAKLTARIAELEHAIEEIKKQTNNCVTTSIIPETIPVEQTSEQIENTSDNASNSDVCQELKIRCSTSPIPTETKSSEDKVVDDFMDRKEKERVSNIIRKRNKGKKIQDQKLIQKTIQSEWAEPKVGDSSQTSAESEQVSIDQKIPYNQKVEQGLMHELSVCAEDNDIENNAIHGLSSDKPFDIQIPELSLEVILTESSRVTAQNIADLFNIAMKVRQKEILYWYCYYKTYEDRIGNIRSIEKIDDKSARTSVYNEIKSLLPDITDVNLRKITFRAKKIYILFEGIGMDRIRQVTYSASAISSLKDIQIQNIINRFPKKNAHVIEPSISNDSEKLPETEVSASSNPTRDHAYFQGSDGNVDYYGITDESSCPLCKLDHDDDSGIEGRYEIGESEIRCSASSYYIKCEQRGIEIEITA